MRCTVGHAVKAALLSAALALITLPDNARAQSGSAGGSIGNSDKTLSGSREPPRTVEPAKPARTSKPEADQLRASRKGEGKGEVKGGSEGGGGSFDGTWVAVATGTPCGTSRETFVISSGRISGELSSGQVSPSGATTSGGSGGGISWHSSGRFSGRSGSGSFTRSDGCTGRWTASKQ
ncbi:hypothetical protein JQ596_23365 [Bradyrhizobium manausense]|uniref:hypothetical protein n=1 Tax=Bradyrhizobium TaxID=374 RepID=UPI001BA50371|nr:MULTISPECIES: hypothetical protein [Bradyrhizobium]MBR0828480.1 hypothetical protein [Bradyrhizobium manausense]UVO25459.1 hypothetical protein KUF59_22940 [Bradyrhizobium arachidis]